MTEKSAKKSPAGKWRVHKRMAKRAAEKKLFDILSGPNFLRLFFESTYCIFLENIV